MIWINNAQLMNLPTRGLAYEKVVDAALSTQYIVSLEDQDSRSNVNCMARALLAARHDNATLRDSVRADIITLVNNPVYSGRALALGRNLGAFVVAADLIDLPSVDPQLDRQWRAKLRELIVTPTTGGPTSLLECHGLRPNNWGTHAGFSLACVHLYLGDTAALNDVVDIFAEFVGETNLPNSFKFGGPWGQEDLSWQADITDPVGINPPFSVIQGKPVDGVIPDDQRRGGVFSWPPPKENYVWEALQGLTATANVLSLAGIPAWQFGNQALLRAVSWLHLVADYPAVGDDCWVSRLVNDAYGSAWPTQLGDPGKNVGWLEWTHCK